MYCRSRNLVEETLTTKKYVADFIYENLDVTTINNYDVIKNHFTNFKIDREYNMFLTDQGSHSLSYLRFKLHKNNINDEECWINLFSITIETDPVIDPTYVYYFREDFDSFPGSFDDFLNNNPNLEGFYIDIEMETTFYLHLDEIVDEDEIEDEDEETVPVEDVFTEDNCLVCLENKPNILFLPCNHLIVCEECESNGKFKYCVKCRKQIFRKIKIENKKFFSDKCVGDDKEKKYVDKCVGDDKKKYVNKGVSSMEDDKKLLKKAKIYFLGKNKIYDEEKQSISEKYNHKKIDIENLNDDIKEKTNIVEYLKKKLEKEEKKLQKLECDLEEITNEE